MATVFSQVELINAALSVVGETAEVSENDGSVEWLTLSREFPLIVESELEGGNYSFTRVETALVGRTDGAYDFDDAFAIPAAALFVRRVYTISGSGHRLEPKWVSDRQFIYVNEPTSITIEYIESADPSQFTALFSRAVSYALQAVALRALKEETQEALVMDQRAQDTFQRARANSSRERSPLQYLNQGQFAAARFRRGAR